MKKILFAAVAASIALATPVAAKSKVSAQDNRQAVLGAFLGVKASLFCPALGLDQKKAVLVSAMVMASNKTTASEAAAVVNRINNDFDEMGQAKFCEVATKVLISSGYGVYIASN